MFLQNKLKNKLQVYFYYFFKYNSVSEGNDVNQLKLCFTAIFYSETIHLIIWVCMWLSQQKTMLGFGLFIEDCCSFTESSLRRNYPQQLTRITCKNNTKLVNYHIDNVKIENCFFLKFLIKILCWCYVMKAKILP